MHVKVSDLKQGLNGTKRSMVVLLGSLNDGMKFEDCVCPKSERNVQEFFNLMGS